MQAAPAVSVLMSVYNGERFVREAVESVLAQTFGDFELIVFNDGSSDGTRAILESFRDSRLRIVHQENVGLTKTLNRGIALARGRHIARMDADDLSLPRRFAEQVARLDADASLGVVCSAAECFGDRQSVICRTAQFAELPAELLRENQIVHGTAMMRREALCGANGYDEHFRYAQDYDLWLRMAWSGVRFAMIPEPLYRLRWHDQSVSQARRADQTACAREAKMKIIRGLRRGVYPVPAALRETTADALLDLAWQWTQEGLRPDARQATLACWRLQPMNVKAMKLLLRSFLPGMPQRASDARTG